MATIKICDKCGDRVDRLMGLFIGDEIEAEICDECRKGYEELRDTHQRRWQQELKDWLKGGK